MNEFIKRYKVLLLVVLVVAVGGIWLATKDGGTDGSKTSSSFNKEVQAKCMADVNEELFCKFASVLELATDSKGNSSMVVKQNGQEQGNLISYNGVTYSKDYTDGQWFKYAAGDTTKPETVDLKKEFVKGDFKADNGEKIGYNKVGTEKCGNLNCYKYQIKDPTKPTEEGFLWFDTKDYLMRRVTIKDGSTNTDMSLSYGAVNISAPSPTKDVPSASSSDQ